MNDDFEEDYYDDDEESSLVDDARDEYDKIQDAKDKYNKYKEKKAGNNNSSGQNSADKAKEFDKSLRDKNVARSNNPQAAQQAGKEAAKKGGQEAAKKAGGQAATTAAANAGGTAAATGGTAAATGGTAAAAGGTAAAAGGTAAAAGGTAAAAGGAVAAQAAVPVVGWIALAVEAVIAAVALGIAAIKKADKKAEESGVNTKGLRRLLMISPILIPFALVVLIIILLVQAETYEKVDFMDQAISCFEASTLTDSCKDFMNTGKKISPSYGPVINATDLEIATFVVQYVTVENKYYGSGGSSFMSDLVNDLNTVAREGLVDDSSVFDRIVQMFQELIDNSIIGDVVYAWNLFKWIKVEKKVFNNINWEKAYVKEKSGFAPVTQLLTWAEVALLDHEPQVGFQDTKTTEPWTAGFNGFDEAYLKIPIGHNRETLIETAAPYIPSWIELYATYVATGDYKLCDSIYDYYTQKTDLITITMYQLTTVKVTEYIETDDTETNYEVTRDGTTTTLTEEEFEEETSKGSQGFFAWLGDVLNDFISAVAVLVDEVLDAIRELLGWNVKVDTSYAYIVTKGSAFKYIVNQSYDIYTEKETEYEDRADFRQQSKHKTIEYKEKEMQTIVKEGQYNYYEASDGLYAKDVGVPWEKYLRVKNNSSDSLTYYTYNFLTFKHVSDSNGKMMQDKDTGQWCTVRNDTSKGITLYSRSQKTEQREVEVKKTAKYKATTKMYIDHEITTWTNKLKYNSMSTTEYDEDNRYAQIFVDMVEEHDYNYTLDDVATAIEVIEAHYDEEYKSTGESIDYSLLPDGQFGWPVPSNMVVAYLFGNTPAYGNNHGGIDVWPGSGKLATDSVVAAREGTVVTSYDGGCADGNRVSSSCGGGYGNYVIISHADKYSTVYAHLSPGTIAVQSGETVSAGQYIGKIGSSGNSTGAHLHYEIKFDGTRIDPLSQYNVVPHSYNKPYKDRVNSEITMATPYKVDFSISGSGGGTGGSSGGSTGGTTTPNTSVITQAGSVNDAMVAFAQQFVGNSLAQMIAIDNADSDVDAFFRDHWCAMFATYCLRKVEKQKNVTTGIEMSAGASNVWSANKDKEGVYDIPRRDGTPRVNMSSNTVTLESIQPGDIVLMNYSPSATWARDHVAIVKSVEKDSSGKVTKIITIDGNSGGGGDYTQSTVMENEWTDSTNPYLSLESIATVISISTLVGGR